MDAYPGLIVLVTADLDTTGVDRSPALITAVGAEGPNGGALVAATVFPPPGRAAYSVAGVELFDYEEYARGLAVGMGGWPVQ